MYETVGKKITDHMGMRGDTIRREDHDLPISFNGCIPLECSRFGPSPSSGWLGHPCIPMAHSSMQAPRIEEKGDGFMQTPPRELATQASGQHPGESLVGKRLGPYEILSLLGKGGMGEVYRARDTRLERLLALKILPANVTDMAERLERFQQEARAISALNHPNICTLYDIGEFSGRSFLVMEYLSGETLSQHLQRGPLPLQQTLDIGIQVADALDAAHQQGIVHRDLKPGNVMLTRTGAKLIDFGLAKLKSQEFLDPSTAETAMQTRPGLLMGTLEYMSPEQLEGRPVDARTDLWALGVMLYEMLTGRRAFERQSRASLIAAILEHDPPPLTKIQPLTPPPLERLVRRCLAKCPNDRWDSAHDVADQLRSIRWSGKAASPIGEIRNRIAKWKWAAIGMLIASALLLKAGAGF